jgi:Ni,Fe-hydrogenase III large subunit/Ni,Fe-hydrogenase III component G
MTRLHPPTTVDVNRESLAGQAASMLDDGWRLALVAAHEDADAFRVVYVFLRPVGERCELTLRVPREDAWIPSLAGVSYPAGRFEREIRDLYGIRPAGHPLPRRLVRHGHWPAGWYPMLREAGPAPAFEPDLGSYPFVDVQGDGVYEIPVGPIHAGLIEPGHFRFSVVGETILRMKARLWFLHRGVEKLFEGREPEAGIELAERISGDTAVGHTLAYVMAVEDALGIEVNDTVRARRALLLELERLYNHVGDLGAIANDVGYGIAHAHTQRLRESLLRHNKTLTGHRLLRGAVGIGTTELRMASDLELVRAVAAEVAQVTDITLGHSVVADRFTGTAVLDAEQAKTLGALGYVARASGLTGDARVEHPFCDLVPAFIPVTEPAGDVRARFLVRAREFAVSASLVADLAARCGGPSPAARPVASGDHAAGLGVVEAWRGTLSHRVELGPDGTISRVKVVDPSWFNWPALPIALADTIVPDFPLANKSFNQSYAGNDL